MIDAKGDARPSLADFYDIIVVASDFHTYLEQLTVVFQRLRLAGLKLKPKKCEILKEKVLYLGHVISAQGVANDPARIEAVYGHSR